MRNAQRMKLEHLKDKTKAEAIALTQPSPLPMNSYGVQETQTFTCGNLSEFSCLKIAVPVISSETC